MFYLKGRKWELSSICCSVSKSPQHPKLGPWDVIFATKGCLSMRSTIGVVAIWAKCPDRCGHPRWCPNHCVKTWPHSFVLRWQHTCYKVSLGLCSTVGRPGLRISLLTFSCRNLERKCTNRKSLYLVLPLIMIFK